MILIGLHVWTDSFGVVSGQTQVISSSLGSLSCLDRQVWVVSGQTKNKILIGLHVWTDRFGVVSGQTQNDMSGQTLFFGCLDRHRFEGLLLW